MEYLAAKSSTRFDVAAASFSRMEDKRSVDDKPFASSTWREVAIRLLAFDKKTWPCKAFYFSCLAGYGCIRPFMSLLLKQKGMSPLEIGIILGVRTLTGSISTILLGFITDLYRCKKAAFITTLIGWLIIGAFICFIPDPNRAAFCAHAEANDSLGNRLTAVVNGQLNSVVSSQDLLSTVLLNSTALPAYATLYSEADSDNHTNIIDTQKVTDLSMLSTTSSISSLSSSVLPTSTPIAYSKESLWWLYDASSKRMTFWIALVLFTMAEIFISPMMSLADTGILHMLENKSTIEYGAQRSWGPLGFGIMLVGTSFKDELI